MKTTAEMIEVMQAFERGETIQYNFRNNSDDGWFDCDCEPMWSWFDHDYRIKPREPRVIWVNEYDAGPLSYGAEGLARMCADRNALRTAVKYIEVIE